MAGLEAAEMCFLRSVQGYTRLDKIRSEIIRTTDLCNTSRDIQTQSQLVQPSRKNGQHQTAETRPQLQTSREKRSWTPQEKMATCR
jgi:hypothetical protein